MKTKLPTPQKLPSGMYRCQVMVDGKRVSVVEADPDVCQAKAVALKNGLIEKTRSPHTLTVGEAIDRYIESKDAVLSPATIAGYKRIRKNALSGIMSTKLSVLTPEKVQREINAMAKSKSPKSVRNAHGLLSATLAEYLPDMVLRTTLPQKRRYEAAIPSDEDIGKILKTTEGTENELPVLLAIWLGLRMSEILGLTWDCVRSGNLYIKQAIVDGENSIPTVKGTKTYSSTRVLPIPTYIQGLLEKQEHTSEHIVNISRRALYCRFQTICKRSGVSQHYRFHDLRHANASVMLALNVPDKYAMERMGHATNNMLKTVYQHTMKSKQHEVSSLVDEYFTLKLHTNLHTEKCDT